MYRKLILNKDFILVVIGRIVSVFGNQILRYALPLYLLNATGSSALFGTILAISFIPMILLFPIGGIVADRVNKRNIMLIMDFCTALLILVFCLLIGRVELIPLMAITMIILYGMDAADKPAVKASIPVLVEDEQIMRANSVIDMIESAASMAGPVIGGLLFSIFGLMPILYVSIGCFLASVVMDVFIHIPFKKREANGNIFSVGLSDLKESFNFIFKKKPTLWKVSIIFASSNLLLTPLILIALPVVITQNLGFTKDTANLLYGYAQGVVAASAVFGGLLAGLLSNKLKSKASPVLLIGCSLSVILCGAAMQIITAPMGVYVMLLIGCGLLLTLHTVFQIQMVTFLQQLTPNALIGKVISCFMCVVMCTIPLGQFLYGFIFEYITNEVYLPFFIAGFVMIIISIVSRRVFYGIDAQIEAQASKPVHNDD